MHEKLPINLLFKVTFRALLHEVIQSLDEIWRPAEVSVKTSL